jgi:hypothetical protein
LALDANVQTAGYEYTPSVLIDASLLSFYLFVRPSYGHYYFGDFFANEYLGLGIYPWYSVNRVPDYSYDPLLAYDQWYYGSRDPAWIRNLEAWHTYYREHPDMRPPRDMAAEQKLAGQMADRPDRSYLLIGRPLRTSSQKSPFRLISLSLSDRKAYLASVRSARDQQAQRLSLEALAPPRVGNGSEIPSTGTGSANETNIGPQKGPLPRHRQPLGSAGANSLRPGVGDPAAGERQTGLKAITATPRYPLAPNLEAVK